MKENKEKFALKIKNAFENIKPSARRVALAAMKDKIGNNLTAQLIEEFKIWQNNGKLKDNPFVANKQQRTLLDLLKFIDEDIPDEEIFKAVKSIFFASVSKDASEQDAILAYEFLQLCKRLNSGDILILKTCYEITQKDAEYKKISGLGNWLDPIAKQLFLPTQMIVLHEKNLMELKLLSERMYSDASGVHPGVNGRLTDLAVKFYQFITKY